MSLTVPEATPAEYERIAHRLSKYGAYYQQSEDKQSWGLVFTWSLDVIDQTAFIGHGRSNLADIALMVPRKMEIFRRKLSAVRAKIRIIRWDLHSSEWLTNKAYDALLCTIQSFSDPQETTIIVHSGYSNAIDYLSTCCRELLAIDTPFGSRLNLLGRTSVDSIPVVYDTRFHREHVSRAFEPNTRILFIQPATAEYLAYLDARLAIQPTDQLSAFVNVPYHLRVIDKHEQYLWAYYPSAEMTCWCRDRNIKLLILRE